MENSMAPERHSEKLWKFLFKKLWEVFSQTLRSIFSKLNGTRTPFWKNSESFFSQNSEEYFLKTLRRIFSKLWEAFSQNKRHPCATLKIISTKMVIFSPRTLFVSATFYGQEHTPLHQARLFAKFYLVSHPGRKVNMLCICCLLPGVLV